MTSLTDEPAGHGDNVEPMASEPPAPVQAARCAFCDNARVVPKTAGFGGASRTICSFCAQAAKTLLVEGCLAEVRHCLHLTACDFERLAEDNLKSSVGPFFRWFGRLRRRLGNGALRELCNCPACKGQVPLGDLSELVERLGIQSETFADTMDLIYLQSMKQSDHIPASDGTIWRVSDEIARRKWENFKATKVNIATMSPPPNHDPDHWISLDESEAPVQAGSDPQPALSARAKPVAPGAWHHRIDPDTGDIVDVYDKIDPELRRHQDINARNNWAAYRKHGAGYFEARPGEPHDYYIDRNGECHPWVRLP